MVGAAWKATGSDSGAWLVAAAVAGGTHSGTAGSRLEEEACGEVAAAAAVVAVVVGVAAAVEFRVKTTTVAEREAD